MVPLLRFSLVHRRLDRRLFSAVERPLCDGPGLWPAICVLCGACGAVFAAREFSRRREHSESTMETLVSDDGHSQILGRQTLMKKSDESREKKNKNRNKNWWDRFPFGFYWLAHFHRCCSYNILYLMWEYLQLRAFSETVTLFFGRSPQF